MSDKEYSLICPECESSEVYYENPMTGSGKYTCQDCEFMSAKTDDFKYAIPAKDYKELLEKLEQFRWIPVSERLPEVSDTSDDTEVLISDGYEVGKAYYAEDGFAAMRDSDMRDGDIKFWMPVPEAPEGGRS